MEEKKTTTTSPYRRGQRLTATVEQVFPFGVFVRLPDGGEGYVRRRELTQDGTLAPEDVVSVGQQLAAVVVELPEPGQRLELSLRQAEPDPWDAFVRAHTLQQSVTATVKNLSAQGAWLQIVPGVDGFVPCSELAPWPIADPGELLWAGDQVEAMITALDRPARRVRLSVRRHMVHQARVQRITEQLRGGEPAGEPPLEVEEAEPATEEPFDLHGLGRVLVVDDDAAVREGLVGWLGRRGCQAEGVGQPAEGFERAQGGGYGLVMVDLDLAGRDGLELIRSLRRVQPDVPVTVISAPDWIAERRAEIEGVRVAEVFAKPLNLDEVADTLSKLARGEAVGPFRTSRPGTAEQASGAFQRLASTMRGGTPLRARLEAALKELARHARADLAALFHLDPASQQIEVVAQAGTLTIRPEAVYGLAQSPVRDLIVRGGEVYETRLSAAVRRRFEKLLAAVDFQSCLGVPVPAHGRVEHALFLFHCDVDGFSRYRLRDACATATLLGVALEDQALEERIQAINPFLVSGQLAAGFGHDVFNKMTGLELQVRSVLAACGARPEGTDPIAANSAPSCAQAVADLDQLLQTTLDLKTTVEAFQQLIRAETEVSFNVNQVAARSALLLRSTALRSKVQIETDLAADLPPVVGSPVRLQQAFLNVMLNAVQHTARKWERWPEGDSRLRLTTGWDAEGPARVWVRFADTGPGIHRQLWDKIFALGFSTRPEGSGLGLFIARSLVQSMGGRITVERSTIPTGTTFLIELPVASGRGGGEGP